MCQLARFHFKSHCHTSTAAQTFEKKIAVNKYLLFSWKITTIEGLGGRTSSYHTLQVALADMNGSQCGFCSPGWIMSMFRYQLQIKFETNQNFISDHFIYAHLYNS